MALATGTKLGPYEIAAPLGAGGMGEVYRARDARLDRDVAIKVLPEALSSNPDFKQRFEREAKAISALQHPHICTLFDVGSQNGTDYLVMELVEGETLAQRLDRGPLPLKELLRYGMEIADALDKAHRRGIVHRDLKPGNVMLTHAGAKLLDFGLAKPVALASPTAATAPAFSAAATLASPVSPITQQGTIVGTVQYMSPEQIEGKEADARSDIFALGCLLYEMATGKRAFEGKSNLSIASAILEKEPEPISAIQPLAPPGLEHVVHRALAKSPEDRWQSASDIRGELQWIAGSGLQAGSSYVGTRGVAPRKHRIERTMWVIGSLLLAAVVGVASYLQFRSAPGFSQRARWKVSAPEGMFFQATGDSGGPVALSPDGSSIAFVAADATGKTQLWVQRLDSLQAVALAGTEGAAWPFWSPDGRSLGFFANRRLKRIDVESGSVVNLCDVRVARGGSWGTDGTIVFSPHVNGGLFRIDASGGAAVALTKLDLAQHDTHRWPFFLPDGKHFLYFAAHHLDISHSRDGLYIGSLDGKVNKRLVHAHTNGAFANGRLLFLSENVLMAQPLDLRRMELTGQPVVVQNGVEQHSTWWLAVFSASQNGVLAFAANQNSGNQLVWLDRDRKPVGTVGEPGAYASLRLSSDGQHLAVEYERPEHVIWVHDLQHNTATQVTFGPAASAHPVLSPDSSKIVFSSQQSGHNDLHIKSLSGAQTEEVLVEANGFNWPLDWSPDGNFLLYLKSDAGSVNPELWVLPMNGTRTPRLLLRAPLYDADGRFSPDMRWIAYTSREQGMQRVFVTPFPGPGIRIPISPGGGSSAVWRKDGGAILHIDDTGDNIQETEVRETGSRLTVGKTRTSPMAVQAPVFQGAAIDVTRDGRIVFVSRGAQNRTHLVVVANWGEGLKP
jgi:Tol biopolymer transport system component